MVMWAVVLGDVKAFWRFGVLMGVEIVCFRRY